MKAVHLAYCRPGSLTIAVAPSRRQSAETVRKAEAFVQRLGIRPRGDPRMEPLRGDLRRMRLNSRWYQHLEVVELA